MYRSYEDPCVLENELKKAQEKYNKITDEDELIDLALYIHELKERINFAWQDDEF